MPTWEEIQEENKHRIAREKNQARRDEERRKKADFDRLRYKLYDREREKHNRVKKTIKELIETYQSKNWKLELDYTEEKQKGLFDELSTGKINQHYFLMYGWSLNEAKEKIEQLKKNLNEDPPSQDKRIASLQKFDKELLSVKIVEQFYESQDDPESYDFSRRDPRWREGLSVAEQLELQNKRTNKTGELTGRPIYDAPLSYGELMKERKIILLDKEIFHARKGMETLEKEVETLDKEIIKAKKKGAKALSPEERKEMINKIREYKTKQKEYKTKQEEYKTKKNQQFQLLRTTLGGKRRRRKRTKKRRKSRKKRRRKRTRKRCKSRRRKKR